MGYPVAAQVPIVMTQDLVPSELVTKVPVQVVAGAGAGTGVGAGTGAGAVLMS